MKEVVKTPPDNAPVTWDKVQDSDFVGIQGFVNKYFIARLDYSKYGAVTLKQEYWSQEFSAFKSKAHVCQYFLNNESCVYIFDSEKELAKWLIK